MPVPTTIADLSTTAASNGPDGATEAGSVLDDYLQAVQALLRQGDTRPASVASASSTAIGGAAGRIVSISGTTTITSFGTISAGIWRIVTFEGALTLTHNGTSLILPGSANITTAAGDSLIAESLGSGNWKVHAYFRAAAPSNITYAGGTVTIDSGATDEALKINGTGSPHISLFDSGAQIGYVHANAGNMAVYGYIGKKLQLGADQSIDWEIDTTGRLLNAANVQPFALATDAAARTSTGVCATYTEVTDTASAFNATTGVYTVPVTGNYMICANGNIDPGGSGGTAVVYININSSEDSGNSVGGGDANGTIGCPFSISQIRRLTASDTVSVSVGSISGTGTGVTVNSFSIYMLG